MEAGNGRKNRNLGDSIWSRRVSVPRTLLEIMKAKSRTLIILAAIGIGAIAVATSYVVLLKPSSPEIYEWNIRTVDTGVVGGLHEEATSISTDSHDKVHICYYDGNHQDLKYATNSSGVWVNYTLDSLGDVGKYNSMAIDTNDKVHISYCDSTNYGIKYATNAGGSWKLDFVVRYEQAGMENSIAVDSKNGVYICYAIGVHISPQDPELRYASNVNGSWTNHTIAIGGKYGSIAIGSNDEIHVAYSNQDGALTYATNENGTWVHTVVDVTGSWWCSIALGGENEGHISYLASTQDGLHPLMYASKADGTWTCTSIYDDVGDMNTGTSIAVDQNNNAHIGFFDFKNWDAKYATNEDGSWSVHTVDDGEYAGLATRMTLDSHNGVHFSYFNPWERSLKYATIAAGQ